MISEEHEKWKITYYVMFPYPHKRCNTLRYDIMS